MKDLELDRAKNPEAVLTDRWDQDANEDDDDDDDTEVNIVDRSKLSSFHFSAAASGKSLHTKAVPPSDNRMLTNVLFLGEEPWPGQYIDVTRARRHEDEDINWPRPG